VFRRRTAPPSPPFDPAPHDLQRARELLARILLDNILPFWYPRTIDAQLGGYRINHDRWGRCRGPVPKRLVIQARALWFFSRLSRSPHGTSDHLAAAAHGYAFLRDRMWDREFGGFYWETDASGRHVTAPGKHLYGQAFALYALSEYARASGCAEAASLADWLFGLLEAHAHDPGYGGYREHFERDWSSPPADTRGYLGVTPDIKLLNTHLHLMEALASPSLLACRPLARERLTELIRIVSTATVRTSAGTWLTPSCACTDQHHRDWTPLRGLRYDRVSYGHDVETVWLLITACEAARISAEPLEGRLRAIFDYSLRFGFDRRQGGFYEMGFLHLPAHKRDKVWWVQAEGLLGALHMYHLTREETYFRCFSRTLDWIASHQVDWEHGEWHARLRGRRSTTDPKADAWKGPYHNSRAMIHCLELLAAIAPPHPVPLPSPGS
jgi:mannobiose 2-epimerase